MVIIRFAWLCASLVFAAGLVLVWHLVSAAALVSPVFLPSPSRVWDALATGFTTGNMSASLAASTARVFGGWLIASISAIALGAAIAMSAAARAYIAPSLEFLRPLPVSAIVPILIGLFGLTEQMVLATIAFGAFWPCLLSTIHGFSAVEPRVLEVGRVLGLSRWAVITKIALPSAGLDIVAGMRVGLTVSLILVVVAEILGGRQGLGYDILLAQRAFKSADLFAGVAVLGLLGYVTSLLIDLVEARLFSWR